MYHMSGNEEIEVDLSSGALVFEGSVSRQFGFCQIAEDRKWKDWNYIARYSNSEFWSLFLKASHAWRCFEVKRKDFKISKSLICQDWQEGKNEE